MGLFYYNNQPLLLTSIEILPASILSGPQFEAPIKSRQKQLMARPPVVLRINATTDSVPKSAISKLLSKRQNLTRI
jgi:hypothetical protein